MFLNEAIARSCKPEARSALDSRGNAASDIDASGVGRIFEASDLEAFLSLSTFHIIETIGYYNYTSCRV